MPIFVLLGLGGIILFLATQSKKKGTAPVVVPPLGNPCLYDASLLPLPILNQINAAVASGLATPMLNLANAIDAQATAIVKTGATPENSLLIKTYRQAAACLRQQAVGKPLSV